MAMSTMAFHRHGALKGFDPEITTWVLKDRKDLPCSHMPKVTPVVLVRGVQKALAMLCHVCAAENNHKIGGLQCLCVLET